MKRREAASTDHSVEASLDECNHAIKRLRLDHSLLNEDMQVDGIAPTSNAAQSTALVLYRHVAPPVEQLCLSVLGNHPDSILANALRRPDARHNTYRKSERSCDAKEDKCTAIVAYVPPSNDELVTIISKAAQMEDSLRMDLD